ncbi:hypothetical protein LCGC14_1098290 [marine sediment metagenome]|uniref:Uncharacterized protein n=1 Tax=marine sediment metagenome TaxID=412755 RepID=A0A0F9MAF0_9ZZZZ
MTLTAIQEDACSGIALLYMGPDAKSDDHVEKLRLAMVVGDVGAAEHESAVILAKLCSTLQAESLSFASARWLEAFDAPAPAGGA